MDIGVVYLIISVSWTRWPIYKIGKSTMRRRKRRATDINRSVKRSRELPLLFAPALNPFRLESALRKRYAQFRYTYRGSGRTEYLKPRTPLVDDLRILSGVLVTFLAYWALFIIVIACLAVGGLVLALVLFQ